MGLGGVLQPELLVVGVVEVVVDPIHVLATTAEELATLPGTALRESEGTHTGRCGHG